MTKKYASIDIGGTAIKYGIIDENGVIISRHERKTEAHLGGPSILAKAVEIVEELQKELAQEYGNEPVEKLAQEHGNEPVEQFEHASGTNGKLSGICISTAGMVDTEKGEIFYAAPLIPNYAGTKFKETMEQKFGLPCEVENDVNCAGLAEYRSGAAKGSRISLMLTIGTGIGGCMIVDGKVFHGFGNSACEVGYMHMDGSDFQTLGAASILSKKVAGWKQEPREAWSGYRIFEEAKKGDALCIRAIDEMADVLGRGIANICFVINPEVVVLGGGIMAQEKFLRGRIECAMEKYLTPNLAKYTRLEFAQHRNDAGMLGAFYNFMS